ncbi:hypothetical protein C8F04DRAFT_1190283 [Mycena alexandri]|uniref:Uncharacterized protein n=1 Tax=Mycena alexandri TaxID=1745969 RepID=A0AAD6SFK5_9AGAR|nr:hypothetical protein C8F04DRAFT_1190283 [Mycena alexandri]
MAAALGTAAAVTTTAAATGDEDGGEGGGEGGGRHRGSGHRPPYPGGNFWAKAVAAGRITRFKNGPAEQSDDDNGSVRNPPSKRPYIADSDDDQPEADRKFEEEPLHSKIRAKFVRASLLTV